MHSDKSDEKAFDSRAYRDALGCFATGVCLIVTEDDEGRARGITVNSFSSVSLAPPIILWSIDVRSDRFDLFMSAERFSVNMLRTGHSDHSQTFAKDVSAELSGDQLARGIGGPGAGQQAKMVNQICIAGIVQGLSEGLAFAQNAGLDPAKVIDAISKGAAQSWQMENRWQTMVDGKFDYGFAIDWMRKDLRIALEEARANGSRLPVAALVDQFYADVQDMGGNRWDTSSLITRLGQEVNHGKS